MKKILLFLLCLGAFPVAASHIVGGEFEMIHLSGTSYRINLILYFDELNGSIGARDPNVNARIFRKRDNRRMMEVFLPLATQTPVSYTQPACSNGEIVTTRMVYTAVVTLPPDEYDDPAGYYLSWERCCRNYNITNIFSNDPLSSGLYAGQTFYLEFPPVSINGEPFYNSSPRLFPPLNDFACPYRPYYVDFAGVDDDGDSLAYSLVTPLNTKTADALPLPDLKPRPRPYPLVTYRDPYGPSNIVGGEPDLHISSDGFLTVTPTSLGLFVFAVRCEEYRDGKKIGEVRRDFQMLVVDGCAPAEPPKILGKKSTDAAFVYDDDMTIAFSNDVTDTDRCIQVQVSDEDALREADNFTENVSIRAIPLNFKKDVSGILPAVHEATLSNGSTVTFDVCFERCPYIENGPFQIGIVAYDDACSLPLSDTLKVTVMVEPPENQDAYFVTPGVTESVVEGVKKEWPIEARDDDGDPVVLGVIADGFNMADVGMEIQQVESAAGVYRAKLVWDSRCDVYDFSAKTSFEIKVLAEDIDDCSFNHPDTISFHLNIILPGNADPVISTDLTYQQVQEGISRKMLESLSFNVYGDDADGDLLALSARGTDFSLPAYGMSFPGGSAAGHVASPFNWRLLCDDISLVDKDTFDLMFIVVDQTNKCRLYKADTLTLQLRAAPPDNAPPELRLVSTNPDLPFAGQQQTIAPGQQVSLDIISSDPDVSPSDHLVIDLVGAEGSVPPAGYTFQPVEGPSELRGLFSWNPDCSVFVDGVYENQYKFTFRTYDDRCQNSRSDTLTVDITVKDVENNIAEFIPPNFVSADHDPGLRNEFFAMVRWNPETDELEDILPKDNCVGHFVGIAIYNRWGKLVFQSADRNFRWYPDDGSSGVYFYTLTFSDKEFKGAVTVRN